MHGDRTSCILRAHVTFEQSIRFRGSAYQTQLFRLPAFHTVAGHFFLCVLSIACLAGEMRRGQSIASLMKMGIALGDR